MFKKLTLITALASSPIAANADLLEFDWQTQGDGDVTLDTDSGKLWLDLDVTAFQSIDSVRLRLQNDPALSYWRIPTLTEIYTLASNSFSDITDPTKLIYNGRATAQETANFSVFGQAVNNSGYTYGFYDNNGTSQLLGSDYGGGYYLNYQLGNNTAYKRVYEGVYLVSDNYSVSIDESAIRSVAPNYNVSSPAVIGALSLFGLALSNRRKTRHNSKG